MSERIDVLNKSLIDIDRQINTQKNIRASATRVQRQSSKDLVNNDIWLKSRDARNILKQVFKDQPVPKNNLPQITPDARLSSQKAIASYNQETNVINLNPQTYAKLASNVRLTVAEIGDVIHELTHGVDMAFSTLDPSIVKPLDIRRPSSKEKRDLDPFLRLYSSADSVMTADGTKSLRESEMRAEVNARRLKGKVFLESEKQIAVRKNDRLLQGTKTSAVGSGNQIKQLQQINSKINSKAVDKFEKDLAQVYTDRVDQYVSLSKDIERLSEKLGRNLTDKDLANTVFALKEKQKQIVEIAKEFDRLNKLASTKIGQIKEVLAQPQPQPQSPAKPLETPAQYIDRNLTAQGVVKAMAISNKTLGTSMSVGNKQQNIDQIISSDKLPEIIKLIQGKLTDEFGKAIVLPDSSTSGKTRYRKQGAETGIRLAPPDFESAQKLIREELTTLKNALDSIAKDFNQTNVNQLANNVNDFIKLLESFEINNGLTKQQSATIQGYKSIGRQLQGNVVSISPDRPLQMGGEYNAGIAKGIENKKPELLNVVAKLGADIDQALADSLEIRSPSKKGEEKGEYYAVGFIKGIVNKIKELLPQAKEAIESVDGYIEPSTTALVDINGPTEKAKRAISKPKTIQELEANIYDGMNIALETLESDIESVPINESLTELDNTIDDSVNAVLDLTEGITERTQKLNDNLDKFTDSFLTRQVQDGIGGNASPLENIGETVRRLIKERRTIKAYGTDTSDDAREVERMVQAMKQEGTPLNISQLIKDLDVDATDMIEMIYNKIAQEMLKAGVDTKQISNLSNPDFLSSDLNKMVDEVFDRVAKELTDTELEDPQLISSAIEAKLQDFNSYIENIEYIMQDSFKRADLAGSDAEFEETERLLREFVNNSVDTIDDFRDEFDRVKAQFDDGILFQDIDLGGDGSGGDIGGFDDAINNSGDFFGKVWTSVDNLNNSLSEQYPLLKNVKSVFGDLFTIVGGAIVLDKFKDLLANVGQESFNAALQVENLERSLSFATGRNGVEVLEQIKQQSKEIGVNFLTASENYRQFTAGTIGTSLNLQADTIANQLTSSFSAYGLSNENQEGAFLAITQLASKGVASMEELRGQLSERLPGAMSIAARSMGMTVTEFNNLVESGQLLSEDLIPALANQLERESFIGLTKSAQSTQAELNRLESNIFNIQTELGKVPLAIASIGLPVLNKTLSAIADNMDVISIFAGSLATAIAGKLVFSIAIATKSLVTALGLVNALQLGFKGLIATTAPFLGMAAAATAVTLAVKNLNDYFNAGSKEIKDYSQQLKALSEQISGVDETSKVVRKMDNDFSNSDGYGIDGFSGVFDGEKWSESFDEFIDFVTARSAKSAKRFNDNLERLGQANQFALNSYLSALTNTDTIDLGNGQEVVTNFSDETVKAVQARLEELRGQQQDLKLRIAFEQSENNPEVLEDLLQQKADVEEEISRVADKAFGNIGAIQKSIEVQKKSISETEKEIEDLQSNRESFTNETYNSRLNAYNASLNEARQGLEKLEQVEKQRNDAIKQTNDLYIKQISVITKIQQSLANIDYTSNLSRMGAEINAVTQRALGNISNFQMEDILRQSRSIEINSKLSVSTSAFKSLETDLANKFRTIDPNVLNTLGQNGLNVENLSDAITSKAVSPEAIAQLLNSADENIKSTIDQNVNVKALLEVAQEYLTTWQRVSDEQLESANLLNEQRQAVIDRNNEIRDFGRSLEDLDLSVRDYVRQRNRQIEDFTRQFEQIEIDVFRQNRDLFEQFEDLGRNLDEQIRSATEEIAQLSTDIDRQSLVNSARGSLSFGADGLFSNMIEFFAGVQSDLDGLNAEQFTLEEQRIQAEQSSLDISRQIRGLSEQREDLERSRLEQLTQLARQQEDFVLGQANSWRQISNQIEDMEIQAKSMGLDFGSIADNITNISSLFEQVYSQVQSMQQNMSLGSFGNTIGGGSNYIDIAAELLKKEEGFRASAYWDVNEFRVGYGTEFRGNTPSAYNIHSTMTKEEAEKQLKEYDIPRFVTRIVDQIGEGVWDNLNENAKAGLVSVAYNYGSLPKQVVSASKSGDIDAIADAVTALSDNKARRKREADLIRNSSTIVSSSNTGGNTLTQSGIMELARMFNVKPTPNNGFGDIRTWGNPNSHHTKGNAVDFGTAYSTEENRRKFVNYILSDPNLLSQVEELIYSPVLGREMIKKGKLVPAGNAYQTHFDHIHIAETTKGQNTYPFRNVSSTNSQVRSNNNIQPIRRTQTQPLTEQRINEITESNVKQLVNDIRAFAPDLIKSDEELRELLTIGENNDIKGLEALMKRRSITLEMLNAKRIDLEMERAKKNEEDAIFRIGQRTQKQIEQQASELQNINDEYENIKTTVSELRINAKGFLTDEEQRKKLIEEEIKPFEEQLKVVKELQENIGKLVDTKDPNAIKKELEAQLASILADDRFSEEYKTAMQGLINDAIKGANNVNRIKGELDGVNESLIETQKLAEQTATVNAELEVTANKLSQIRSIVDGLGENWSFSSSFAESFSLSLSNMEIEDKFDRLTKQAQERLNSLTIGKDGKLIDLSTLSQFDLDTIDFLQKMLDGGLDSREAVEKTKKAIENTFNRAIQGLQFEADILDFIGRKKYENDPLGGGVKERAASEALKIELEYLRQIEQLEKEIAEAEANGDQAKVDRLEQYRQQIENIRAKELENLRYELSTLKQVAEQPLANFFSSAITNIGNVQQALSSLFSSIAQNLANIVAQEASSALLKGIFGSFLGGLFGGGSSIGTTGASPVGNFAYGGYAKSFEMGSPLSLMKGIDLAMKREGRGATLAVVNDREPILSDLTGDAQLYQQLVQDGVWNQMKTSYNKINSYVPNFKFGRSNGSNTSTISNVNNERKNVVINEYNSVNVSTPSVQSFNESRSQIAHREKVLRKRNRRNRN